MPEREIRCKCTKIHIVTIDIEFEHVFGLVTGVDLGPSRISRTLGYICPEDLKKKQVTLEFDESATERISNIAITNVRNK